MADLTHTLPFNTVAIEPISLATWKINASLISSAFLSPSLIILAREIADEVGVKSFIVDPVVVDELIPIARYSGVPELPRTSVFHALNQKAVAKRYAKETNKAYALVFRKKDWIWRR